MLLFEGAVITQYLDEAFAPHFQPAQPLQRARYQAWAAFGLLIIRNLFSTYMAKDVETYAASLAAMLSNLARVEAELEGGPYFAGAEIALVDFSYAPLFVRLEIFDQTYDLGILDRFPKIKAWAEVLRARPSTQNSVPDTFEAHYRGRIGNKQSYVAKIER